METINNGKYFLDEAVRIAKKTNHTVLEITDAISKLRSISEDTHLSPAEIVALVENVANTAGIDDFKKIFELELSEVKENERD